jgi:hypothetical protein
MDSKYSLGLGTIYVFALKNMGKSQKSKKEFTCYYSFSSLNSTTKDRSLKPIKDPWLTGRNNSIKLVNNRNYYYLSIGCNKQVVKQKDNSTIF